MLGQARNGLGLITGPRGGIWTPDKATSATLRGWYECDTRYVTLVSGNASQVNNLISGGANPLVQASSSARPAFTANGWGVGGKPALTFDGVAHVMTANGLAAYVTGTDQPFSVLMMAQILTLGSNVAIRKVWSFGKSTDDNPLHDLRLPASTTNVLTNARRDSAAVQKIKDAATAADLNRHCFGTVFSGTKVKYQVDGTTDTNLDGASATTADSDVGDLTTIDTFSIAAAVRTTTAGFVNMKWAATLVYQGALSAVDLAQATRYLLARFPLS